MGSDLARPRLRVTRLRALLVLTGLFAAFSLVLATATAVKAADPPNQPFDLIYQESDVKHRVVQLGEGMFGKTSGTIENVTIDGDIVKAYLIWAGLGRDDDGVTFQRNGDTPTLIMQDKVWNNDTFGANTWNCCGNELSVYYADITGTGIVVPGTNSYTLSDMSIVHNNDQEENWGYGLVVIYQDDSLPKTRDIYIKLGNDGLFYNWTGLLGPNSDVQCIAFEPSPLPRRIIFEVVVGGVQNETRHNGLWSGIGSEDFVDIDDQGGTWTQTSGLIHLPDGIVGVPRADGTNGGVQTDGPFPMDWLLGPKDEDEGSPFADREGDEWDNYPPPETNERIVRTIDPGETWACLQVESADQRNRPGLPEPGPGSTNRPASIGFIGLGIIIEAADEPDIDIVKYTNGQDANDPDGSDVPTIAPGDTVTWTYAVSNTGTVTIPLSQITVTDNVIGTVTQIVDQGDGDDDLAPGEQWLYQAVGTAIDLANPPDDESLILVSDVCTQDGAVTPPSTAYTNIGTVTIPTTSASDPSSYCGPQPEIDIIKYTNGQDANDPDGADVPTIAPGATVTWTYDVTNIGSVAIASADITVTDSVIGTITQIVDQGNGDDFLDPGESWLFQAVGVAINLVNPPADPDLELVDDVCTQDGAVTPASRAYTNVGTVTTPGGSASDPSSYCSEAPEIDIIKYTNGQDANDPNGLDVPVIESNDGVTWTYAVTNIGTVDINEEDITVTDNVIGAITQIIDKADGDAVLTPNETWIYAATGTALDLSVSQPNPNLQLVPNVCTRGGESPPRIGYTNIGTVTIPADSASDPSSYCGPPPTAIAVTDEPTRLPGEENIFLYLPMIIR